ncbi:tetratricopeptide repeat protein [Desulfogranum japonicum]|uniref:tetratricopeptide repeat protein n=1 Tax=Desulfogranum japonicum TaxID=231447 RepID=UPI000404EF32|nr:tetratricopeptide repeat protein [Desulfogranum japonicum]
MNNSKCVICLKVKGKRLCKLQERSFVCPRCCAEIRNTDCSGCSHYVQAAKHSFEKMKKSKFKDFMPIIDPEIDDAVDKALAMVERGNIEAGEKSLIDLIKIHPNIHIVQYGMGTVLAMKGNYAESIVHFDKSLQIFPYFVEAWFNRGNSYKNLFNVGEAIKSFQKVIEFGAPQDEFVKTAKELIDYMGQSILNDTGLSLDLYVKSMDDFNKAFQTMQKKEYEKAITEFQNVIKINKSNAQTYGNLGLCYAFLGQKEESIASFDQALTIDPSYEPAITNRAIVLSLKNGERLPDDHVITVEYYKDVAEQMKSNTPQ